MITLTFDKGHYTATVSGDDIKQVLRDAALFAELPRKCPRCDAPAHLTYWQAQNFHFYGMQCASGHRTKFGSFQDGKSFFYKGQERWVSPSEFVQEDE